MPPATHVFRRLRQCGLRGRVPAAVALCAVLGACTARPATTPPAPSARGGIALLSARCAGARSCLLGHVVDARDALPQARAAVFLEREGSADDPVRFVTLTDDEGVFEVQNPPPGRYRLAIYKGAGHIEVHGLSTESDGTLLVPVRIP